ncbi:maltase 2-like [Planococcus citri]|uniref:maltase 2-like n=1 Tax=Planococcus citri TaxID=170843 RepID=UPI0031F89BB0
MKFVLITIISVLISSCWSVDRTWWKYATMYEVFLKSFKDSNGDGIGDLKGITSKLDYFVDIGVDTIWVTPFYPSSGADAGYDITDFCGIDSTYGTMADFEQLLREMKLRGLNFIMDLVINHSSDEHDWFQKSINKVDKYTDYYIWADPKGYDKNGNPIPPNNWPSIFDFNKESSSWTWNEKRKQFYFHQFGVKQPDFNLRNDELKKDLKAIMKFWLDKGVTSFRVDATPFFMEDPLLRDDEFVNQLTKTAAGTEDGFTYRLNHPDTYTFLNEFYLFLRQYDRKNKKERQSVMMAEAYGHIKIIMNYYGVGKMPVVHFPFNFQLTRLHQYFDAQQMMDYLNIWLKNIPEGAASNWALGNHDQGRIFNRFSKEYNYILLTLVSMLPGTSIIYYGEEMTQEFLDFTPERKKDLWVERDHFRLPMQWDDSLNAGFTSAEKPWLPLHPSYWHKNVEAQRLQQNSSLNYYKDLTSIRKTQVSKFGDMEFYTISKWVLAFTRTYHQSTYVIVLNLGMESSLVDLHSSISNLPTTLLVEAASPNSGYKKGQKFSTVSSGDNFSVLRPHSSVVLSTEKEL